MDISVYITSELTASERRVSPQWDVAFFKRKLELTTGVEPRHQTLHYYPRPNDSQYVVLADSGRYDAAADEATTVAQLELVPYSRIHVVDTDQNSVAAQLAGEAGATSGSEGDEDAARFQYSDEQYAQRGDLVLAWKREQGLGRFAPDFQAIKQRNAAENEALSAGIEVGSRCRNINIQGERRGVVRFVGRLPRLDQGELVWVGVEFDEPVGKNSGRIDGEVVFECRHNHGSFLKPKQVEVGDFPELDPFGSDDEL